MILQSILGLTVAIALFGSAEAQSVFPGGPRYDGLIRLVKLTGASCPAGQEDQAFNAAYRAKVRPTQLAEAMSVAIPAPAGGIFLVAEGDGTFRGADQKASGTLILDAYRQALPKNTIFNLNFDPNVIGESTASFTFRGTVENYIFPGCTAQIRGTFDKR